MIPDSNVEIIPAILAKNINEVREKIRLVEGAAEWVHLDIMDGKFVPKTTWNNPQEFLTLRYPLKFEIHLMVEKPEAVYLDWLLAGASRIIWHYEVHPVTASSNWAGKHKEIAADVRRRGVEAGIALNPEVPPEALNGLISEIDMVLVMANTPGLGGQEFREETLEKIKALRSFWPNGKIGVDIGINPVTALKATAAGANVLIAGSYIFGSRTPREALEELQAAAGAAPV